MEKHHRRCFPFFFFFLISATVPVGYGYQNKVGDLNAWGIPPPSNPRVYSLWSEYNHPLVGDSLLFLYPPSQDSVIPVTVAAFAGCNTSDPILNMNDGNSLFNVTSGRSTSLAARLATARRTRSSSSRSGLDQRLAG
ncbi:hypothetical protein MLD38_031849 [Melastoma candidum]|uniref:Uncharacterized protein n=1 Tax=Melastoma candidum TaxID=119954 RepID=A0ACB9MQJ6_9MYRT|nr:hypothetical protein MLD38_031849 [Melastoma candidum]